MITSQKQQINGLYEIALGRLRELSSQAHSKSGIIRFPLVFGKLCRNFCINKKQCWELLFALRECRVIEIVPYQGIKLMAME
ncbi:MAG: hypothetical protein PHS34_08125 [Candidatus Omnitrophica bacterium]|nr:hypothetical protein [Candidatus Nanoarchaeia archaeon]MDD5551210.1 hypothetical protein [Candidatus Omnitrophota bacterium]